MQYIYNGTFGTVPLLKKLDLSNNLLTGLQSGAFDPLLSLEDLSVWP